MGGFYGSTQVKTADRDVVIAAVETAARKLRTKALVGPQLGEWIGVYPKGHGQDTRMAELLASAVGCDVFHFLVHDDDVLAYWYWRDGRLIDSYNSRPDYFDEEEEDAGNTDSSGTPARYAHLLGDKAAEFDALLHSDDHSFELGRLERMGDLLGIRNLVTAYEYLLAGDFEGITESDKFVEVPQATAKKRRAAAAARAEEADRERTALRHAGVLLAEVERHVVWEFEPCAVGDGFLMTWRSAGERNPEVAYLAPPWVESQPAPRQLLTTQQVAASDGLFTLGDGQLAKRDWPTLAPRWTVSTTARSLKRCGDWILASGEASTEVYAAADGRLHAVLPGPTHSPTAVDPTGIWCASDGLRLGRITDDRSSRTFYAGGQWSPAQAPPVGNPKDVEARLRAVSEKRLRSMEKSGMTADMLATVRAQVEQIIAQQVAEAVSPPVLPRYARESVMTLGWTADGNQFWCGTEVAMRVFDWPGLYEAPPGDDLPPAKFEHVTAQRDRFGNPKLGHIYAAFEDVERSLLVFGGLAGVLWTLNLKTGACMEILRLPADGAIRSAALSNDRQTLCITSISGFGRDEPGRSNPTKTQSVWSVWSYPELLARARL